MIMNTRCAGRCQRGDGGAAAAHSRVRACHEEVAGDGIRTVAIAPGRTDTPGMRDIVTAEYIERLAARYPGGRLGLTAFLCSDAASQLSGTVIMVRPPVALPRRGLAARQSADNVHYVKYCVLGLLWRWVASGRDPSEWVLRGCQRRRAAGSRAGLTQPSSAGLRVTPGGTMESIASRTSSLRSTSVTVSCDSRWSIVRGPMIAEVIAGWRRTNAMASSMRLTRAWSARLVRASAASSLRWLSGRDRSNRLARRARAGEVGPACSSLRYQPRYAPRRAGRASGGRRSRDHLLAIGGRCQPGHPPDAQHVARRGEKERQQQPGDHRSPPDPGAVPRGL